MSTATQENLGFQEAKIAKVPSLACIGTVGEVGEGKISSTGSYVVQPISLRANGPGRGTRLNLLYQFDWLVRGFDPASLDEYENGASMLSVYRRNIAVKDGISNLKGLAGSDAAYQTLGSLLLTEQVRATYKSTEEEKANAIEAIQNILREFLMVTNEETLVGYVLKQRKEKTVDSETGKTTYELASGYEVGEWFFTTPESIKKVKLRADRSKDGMFRLGFDPDEF